MNLEAGQHPWEYSAFDVTVARTRRITPGFVRLTLAGAALRHFAPWGLDQRIKLVVPMPDGSRPEFGLLQTPTPHPREWYTRWKMLPEGRRNALRTYTPSAIRPDAGEIDIDIFIHEPAGPASAWALGCSVGDEVVVTGPDVRVGYTGYGIHYVPPRPPSRVLLIGDESAAPAMSNIRASLASGARGTLLLEVRDPRDAVLLGDEAGVRVIERRGAPGAVLLDAVREWGEAHGAEMRDDTGFYAWIAGETTATTVIRRELTEALGIPPAQIAFLGYWKEGGPLVG